MYLTPESLGHWFTVENRQSRISNAGRKEYEYEDNGQRFAGILAQAKTAEIERWKQLQHPITHTIIQEGGDEIAHIGDRLVYKGRYFYIQGYDDIASLGLYRLYYVEERGDMRGPDS